MLECKELRQKLKIPIVEMFSAIQGEGTTMGQPQFFIRVAGCNLRCLGNCDTQYSWDIKEDYYITIEEIRKTIEDSGIKNICLTGGEPALYAKEFIVLMHSLPEAYKLILQTNGTIYDGELFNNCFLVAMDMKSPSFGGGSDSSIIEKLSAGGSFDPLYEIKVVILTDADIDFAIEINKLTARRNIPLILQSGNSTCKTVDYNILLSFKEDRNNALNAYKELVKKIFDRKREFMNFSLIRILPQMHVLMYGKERRR